MEASFTDHVPDGIIRMGLGGVAQDLPPDTHFADTRSRRSYCDALIHGRDPNIVLDEK